ncbi:MAG: hypothetical protein JSS79_17155 [Bacteroidetes bacterium]|nr:hypothetical protein [Bacteroidota bacterium]
MKPFVKYSVILFLFLLTGYCQLFSPLVKNLGYSPQSYDVIQSASDKPMLSKVVEKESVFMEEEEKEDDERFHTRKLPKVFTVLFFGHAPDVLQARLQSHLAIHNTRYSSSRASFSEGVCRILRL